MVGGYRGGDRLGFFLFYGGDRGRLGIFECRLLDDDLGACWKCGQCESNSGPMRDPTSHTDRILTVVIPYSRGGFFGPDRRLGLNLRVIESGDDCRELTGDTGRFERQGGG